MYFDVMTKEGRYYFQLLIFKVQELTQGCNMFPEFCWCYFFWTLQLENSAMFSQGIITPNELQRS